MISAILLAAGQSKRMSGRNKLIKEINNIPIIKHSVKNILNSKVDELIIVLGYQKDVIHKYIDKDKKINVVYNKNFKNGMASSIKIGLKNLSKNTNYFFICLGDMPMVSVNVYNKLIDSKDKNEIIVPTYNGISGNPVLFSKYIKKKIFNIEGDFGAKKIIKLNEEKVFKLPVNEEGVTLDFDKLENF